jgi:galactokinase
VSNFSFNQFDFDIKIASPGRINFIGEHTDYNNGFVLPTAIDKKIYFKFRKNNSTSTASIFSENFNKKLTVNLFNVQPSKNHWENYILGVLFEIQQITDNVKGFDCVFKSDIPIGSGISSSAALECGFAFGLNELFQLNLSKKAIIELSQRAEHNFVGTKCGIMDQFTSVMSKKDNLILLDCESLDYQYVPIKIEPYKILLLNTNVSHSLASSEYNTRRKECETGVDIMRKHNQSVTALRNATIDLLNEIKLEISPKIYNRCKYVIEENSRVLQAVELLKTDNLNDFGALMYETHNGLQHLYEVSCSELDFLVDFTKNNTAIIGARMMGGGFGGCTINLIHANAINNFVAEVSQAYYKKFNIELTAFEALPSEGTQLLKV